MSHRHGPPVGARETADVDPSGAVMQSAPAVQTLHDLREQFVFFTPALLVTHAHFDRDPVFEYVEQMAVPESERPMSIDCQMPFFSRLGKTQLGRYPHSVEVMWDHRLYACHAHRWEECREFICRIAVTDRQRRLYAAVSWYSLPVVDVTTLAARPAMRLPLIDVVVFAVHTNYNTHYLARAIDPPRSRPYPATLPPTDEAVAVAAAIFDSESGSSDARLLS